MQLLLFRHGVAQDIGADGDDASRHLTKEGIEKTKAAARGLHKIIDKPQVIFTSPLIRAKQTADILAAVFDLPPLLMPSLATGPAELVMHDLRKLRESIVILVGHEPTLSQLGAKLCTGSDPVQFLQLKKAGAMLIDTAVNEGATVGAGKLLWLATPVMLREMA